MKLLANLIRTNFSITAIGSLLFSVVFSFPLPLAGSDLSIEGLVSKLEERKEKFPSGKIELTVVHYRLGHESGDAVIEKINRASLFSEPGTGSSDAREFREKFIAEGVVSLLTQIGLGRSENLFWHQDGEILIKQSQSFYDEDLVVHIGARHYDFIEGTKIRIPHSFLILKVMSDLEESRLIMYTIERWKSAVIGEEHLTIPLKENVRIRNEVLREK